MDEGAFLPAFVETTLKDDAREDPPITKDALDILGIVSAMDYEVLKDLTQKIATIIKEELSKKNIDSHDIKFEFGKIGEQIVFIDGISGGNMRAYRHGKYILPLDLEKIILEKINIFLNISNFLSGCDIIVCGCCILLPKSSYLENRFFRLSLLILSSSLQYSLIP
ncbi:MAG TPA: hypothetical protein O0Y05_02535 [Methanocorpusculum sp.]|nr:hypothetical protein [Methanocorpusculum sp.]